MFGLGGMEILVILLVGVVVLGPERLPKVMRSFTKVMSEFRRISTDLQRTINSEINLEEFNRQNKIDGKKAPVKKKKKKKAAPKPEDGTAVASAAEATSPEVPSPEQFSDTPAAAAANAEAPVTSEAPAENNDSGEKA